MSGVPVGVTLVSFVAATLLTLVAYGIAVWLYRRSGWPLLLPVFVAAAIVSLVLWGWGIPYAAYRDGSWLVSWMTGPATVALAVPLYHQRARLRGMLWPVLGALAAGSVTAVLSAVGIAWLFGADGSLIMSLAPKSATMAVAMPVAEYVGGVASLTAVATALTGISAAVLCSGVFAVLAIRSDVARGFALGATAHAIGTATALEYSETAMGFAALAMGLNAIATSVLVPLLAMLWV